MTGFIIGLKDFRVRKIREEGQRRRRWWRREEKGTKKNLGILFDFSRGGWQKRPNDDPIDEASSRESVPWLRKLSSDVSNPFLSTDTRAATCTTRPSSFSTSARRYCGISFQTIRWMFLLLFF